MKHNKTSVESVDLENNTYVDLKFMWWEVGGVRGA